MLVDTSVWMDFFNGHRSAHADRLAAAIADSEAIALPGLVITEILVGLRSDAEADKILRLLDAFGPGPEPTRADHVAAARLYRLCRGKGVTIRSTIDCLIAQLCLRDRLELLTLDRDFTGIARCAPLRLVAA
jgi:predicted nucleic acid-binding protein